MNKSPLVSVIIPAYNAEKYLSDAVKSILKQTYKNLEIIIIDDNSKDDTYNIAASLAKTDKRIKLLKNKQNLGIGGNRNLGIKFAKGKYIAWQDADDVSLPHRVEKQVELMEGNPEIGVVGCYLQFFRDNSNKGIRKYSEQDEKLRKMIFKCNPVAQPASMFRKDVFKRVGIYNLKYKVASEDLEMFFRTGTKYKFANVPEALVKYRENNDSLTANNLKEMEMITIKLRFQYFNHPAYKAHLIDYIYNVFQYISIFILPGRFKVKIFNLIRNSK